ncbi:MAG: LysR family transcriptional regulator [Pseudooceanicola sp.]|nr:LysR family transcriptional regulator [Pseudooceanicola sp.]
MSVTLKQLEAFVRIADLGSFRAAAERLNTTQPNISARIAALEAVLDVTLMERDAGSVRLTPRGRDLLEHARAVLRQTETLIAASGRPGLFDGTLRLGVTEMIVHTWLQDFLRALRARFPKLSVELTVEMSAKLEEDLAVRRIDLALQNGPFARMASGTVTLGRYPMIWVAAPSLGLSGAQTAEGIAAHPVLTHARGTPPHAQVAGHFRAMEQAVRLVPSSNLAACLQMAVQGMGIAALPAAMARRELAAGEVEQLDYPWAPDDLVFAARYDARTAPGFVAEAAEIAREVDAAFS